MLEILASLMMIVPTNAADSKTKMPEAKDIAISFRGIRSDEGKIQIAIFDAREAGSFPKGERALKHVSVVNESKDGSMTVTIPDLPVGEYAFAIFHDEDSNGEFKFGAFGIPREGLAFSNNPKIYFGPPSFDKAKVDVRTISHLDIQMKYF